MDSVFVSVVVAGATLRVVAVSEDSVFVSVLAAGAKLRVFAVSVVVMTFSLVFFVTDASLFSTFFSGAGEEAGTTTSVFCSHAPTRAAQARMQIIFFIWFICCSTLGPSLNRNKAIFRPC